MTHLQILQELKKIYKTDFYLVGGFVRNFLKNIKSEDYDLTSKLTPDEIIKHAPQEQLKIFPTGLQHGTVTMILGPHNLEITTFRKDLINNGRHSHVKFSTSIKEDSKRRDFTINALYMDCHGTIFDFHNGQNDLKKGKLRFIGDPSKRISEDYLRILRFWRFFADFDKNNISLREPKVLKAFDELSHNLSLLSADRISQEFIKMTQSKNYHRSFTGMCQVAPLIQIFNLKKQYIKKLPDNLIIDSFVKICLIYRKNLTDLLSNPNFNWSNNQKKIIKDCLLLNTKSSFIHTAVQHSKPAMQFYILNNYFDHNIEKTEIHKLLTQLDNLPYFELNGSELIAIGAKPGPQLGKIIKQTKHFWLTNNFPKKQLCLDYASKLIKK